MNMCIYTHCISEIRYCKNISVESIRAIKRSKLAVTCYELKILAKSFCREKFYLDLILALFQEAPSHHFNVAIDVVAQMHKYSLSTQVS